MSRAWGALSSAPLPVDADADRWWRVWLAVVCVVAALGMIASSSPSPAPPPPSVDSPAPRSGPPGGVLAV